MSSKRSRPVQNFREHPSGARIAHVDTDDGRLVALGNLRVLITKEDGAWLAQGLEIDYAIDGTTLTEVKQRFESGLSMTIDSHLRVHNSIDHLLQQAPDDVWADYYATRNNLRRFALSGLNVYPTLQKHLPFEGIDYYTDNDEADSDTPATQRKRA